MKRSYIMSALLSKRELEPRVPEVNLPTETAQHEQGPTREQHEGESKRGGVDEGRAEQTIIRRVISSVKSSGEEQITVEERTVKEKIEDILADGLDDLYKNLPADKQEEFKAEGERAAGQIVVLLRSVKIKMSRIFHLIRRWLKIIPGVNRYFLNQEAKLKADRIYQMEVDRRRGK